MFIKKNFSPNWAGPAEARPRPSSAPPRPSSPTGTPPGVRCRPVTGRPFPAPPCLPSSYKAAARTPLSLPHLAARSRAAAAPFAATARTRRSSSSDEIRRRRPAPSRRPRPELPPPSSPPRRPAPSGGDARAGELPEPPPRPRPKPPPPSSRTPVIAAVTAASLVVGSGSNDPDRFVFFHETFSLISKRLLC